MVLFIFCLSSLFLWLAFTQKIEITPIERYATFLFAMFLSLWVDVVLGLMYDRYYYFVKGAEWKDFIFHFMMYPAISCLFLNSFPFKKNLIIKAVYFLGWSAIAFGYERFFVYIKVFHYQNYHFKYSLIAYPLLFILLISNFYFVRWLLIKSCKGKGKINEKT